MSKKKSDLKEKLRWFFGHFLAVVAVVVILIVFGAAYYFVIAPYLVTKPFIEKPVLPEDALDRIRAGEHVIKEEHINYIINEIGAYKLRAPFGSKSLPIMEFVLTDINKIYYSYVKKHLPVTKEGNPKGEDVIIKSSQETAYNILKEIDTKSAVKKAKEDRNFTLEMKKDMKTLAAKSYLQVYENIR